MDSSNAMVSERYRRLAGLFGDKVAGVAPDQWELRTPCEGWTVRELVGHVIATQGIFLGLVGRQMPDLPSASVDPVGAWRRASAVVQADLDNPERANAEFEGMAGPSTFAAAVDRFLCFDQVVHGWDVAHATGQDESIDAAEIERVQADAESLGDALRGPSAFGPAVPVAEDADPQAKLLAFLGRRI
ncbi:MAG: hypothetical protein JWN95_963 [Frankiales bacterium]|nr:hypothetical protein [Frankiales bacterium]